MFKEIGRVTELLKYPQNKILDLDKVATTALRKGMPIEQVQLMLGHEQIDTTMIYAKTDTKNVKYSHDKYM